MTIDQHTASWTAAARARERLADFEGLGTKGYVPNGYQGLDWFHLTLDDRRSRGDTHARNEWAQGSGFTKAEGLFDLDSLTLTSEGAPSVFVDIFGYKDGELIDSVTVEVSRKKSGTIVDLDWAGIDTVTFNSANGFFWHLDNVVFTPRRDRPIASPHPSVFDAESAHHHGALALAPTQAFVEASHPHDMTALV